MKKSLCLVAALALAAPIANAGPVEWAAPQDPFAVYGNTYYVGTTASAPC